MVKLIIRSRQSFPCVQGVRHPRKGTRCLVAHFRPHPLFAAPAKSMLVFRLHPLFAARAKSVLSVHGAPRRAILVQAAESDSGRGKASSAVRLKFAAEHDSGPGGASSAVRAPCCCCRWLSLGGCAGYLALAWGVALRRPAASNHCRELFLCVV